MPKYPTNPALEAALVAHPDEDTPRLAYADWLDENGDPDRAAFIRTQCRLADLPPNDPDWVDLREQQDELVARLRSRFLTNLAGKPDRFYTGLYLLGDHEEPFRRGFPYFIGCQTSGSQWTRDEVTRVVDGLTRLVRTTTLRGFQPYTIPIDRLIDLLSAPVIAELTGLAIAPEGTPGNWEAENATLYRHLVTNPSLRRVKHLYLYQGTSPGAVAELTRARTFDSVVRLTIQNIVAPKDALLKLTKAPWIRRLGHFRSHLADPDVAVPVVTGLAELPALHTLELPDFSARGVPYLVEGEFPALARILYYGPFDGGSAGLLAGARFPALVAFEAWGGRMNNDGLADLMRGEWFERLRVLAVPNASIGDRSVKQLAAHPIAKGLRVLKLGDNAFGKGALAALARPSAFSALTTLDLYSYRKRKATPADLATFLSALQIPTLRHLNLGGWPLGDEGAQALAANPTLTNLTRLTVHGCGIGDPGARALFASPHLQNLVELQMGNNPIKTGADALADPAVMPRLGECRLSLSQGAAAKKKLQRDGLFLSVT